MGNSVSIAAFVLVLCVGAAFLGLWFVVRFPDAGPSEMTRALLHVALSLLVLQLMASSISALSGFSVAVARFVASFGLVLPSLIYMFVAAAWLIRTAGTRLQGRH